VDKIAEKICQKGIVIRIPPHYFSKIRFSYIEAYRLNSLESTREFKLNSFTQKLLVAAKRLDFCQLLLEIYVKTSLLFVSITVPKINSITIIIFNYPCYLAELLGYLKYYKSRAKFCNLVIRDRIL
jgi:hypothetical protein